MLEEAKKQIRATISYNEKILVGISGGADSIALAHLLYSMGYTVLLVHINFHLRGEESERDQRFVEEFCKLHFPNIDLLISSAQTTAVAHQEGISIEMAARQIRYEIFEILATQNQCQWIAVAHHADDQIETSLLNLARGTGGAGIAGMKRVNGKIFRPFLTTSKSEILDYLKDKQLDFVHDSTNDDTAIHRNYIRHILIPTFERLNPSFRKSLLESMSHFEEEQEVLNEQKERFIADYVDMSELSVALNNIVDSRSRRYFFKRWINDLGFNYSQAEDMLLSWESEKTISFYTGDTLAQMYRGKLFVIKNSSNFNGFSPLLLNKLTSLEYFTIDYDSLGGTKTLYLGSAFRNKELLLRMGRNEDYFQPFGMKKGKKALFRYLGEKGVPEYYRPFCPVIECEGQIIAVLPFEISEYAKANDLKDSLTIGIEFAPTPLGSILGHLVSGCEVYGRN